MGKFFSIPDMGPSGGEGKMNSSRPAPTVEPTREQLEQRFPDYWKNIDKPSTASFSDVGDEFKFAGENAVVRHVEKNNDGTQEVIVQKSARGNSGTYQLSTSQDKDRKQYISKVKRTFD